MSAFFEMFIIFGRDQFLKTIRVSEVVCHWDEHLLDAWTWQQSPEYCPHAKFKFFDYEYKWQRWHFPAEGLQKIRTFACDVCFDFHGSNFLSGTVLKQYFENNLIIIWLELHCNSTESVKLYDLEEFFFPAVSASAVTQFYIFQSKIAWFEIMFNISNRRLYTNFTSC